MKTLAEKIEVMNASLDGKRIQIKRHNESDWDDADGELEWNWERFDYRVKPEPQEPIEIWVNVYSSGKIGGPWIHKESALQAAEIASGPYKTKLFREVMEAEQ